MEATHDYSFERDREPVSGTRTERGCGKDAADDARALLRTLDKAEYMHGFSVAPLRRTRLAQLLWMPSKNLRLRVRILG